MSKRKPIDKCHVYYSLGKMKIDAFGKDKSGYFWGLKAQIYCVKFRKDEKSEHYSELFRAETLKEAMIRVKEIIATRYCVDFERVFLWRD